MESKTWLFYAVALLCFMLPFGNISCSGAPGKTIAKASGVQIILDKVTMTDPEMSGESKKEDGKNNFHFGIRALVAIAMLALAAGIACLLKFPSFYAVACSAGAGAAACLVIGLLVMRDSAAQNGFIISPSYGWWLALLLSLAGSACSFWFGRKNKA